jgi:type I restriction enzyme, S subunit
MRQIPLAQVAHINPRPPRGLEDSEEISFVAMASVSEDGGISHQETRKFRAVKKGFTYFRRGDVLLAKITPCFENGKSALADNLEHSTGFGSTEFHVLRAIPGKSDPRFLYHLVRSKQLLFLGKRSMKGAAGHKRVPAEFLEQFEIPEWPLDDQIRIAHLLSKVEGLISQRKHRLQQLDDLVKSVFLEMFGDPVRNEKDWATQPFSQVGKFTSGGTPSKSRDDYWAGEYPWVSPKDMKVPRIFDSEDHISEKVFDETSLKRIAPGHLLIVVRGMILAHSFPVAINMIDVAINQDMKAIKLNGNLRTTYLFHCLNALKRQILKLITTAGHGTKKFDSNVMEKLLVPVPPPEMQDDFLSIADKVEDIRFNYQQSLTNLEALYGALSKKAFKGELDLSRVPLPETTEPMSNEMDSTDSLQPKAAVLLLHETDLLLAAINEREMIKPFLNYWLEKYTEQLGDMAFSVDEFMLKVESLAEEAFPDREFELGANAYDLIKAWVLDALRAGRLEQVYPNSDDDTRVALRKPLAAAEG